MLILSPPSTADPSYSLFIAKYDSFSEKKEHLSFKKGDHLYITNRGEGNWWYARAKHSEQEGYIPINYVTKFRAPKPDPKRPKCSLNVAKYDHFSKEDKHLNFKKGGLMYLINSTEGECCLVKSKETGQEGYIPKNYIAEYNTLDAEE